MSTNSNHFKQLESSVILNSHFSQNYKPSRGRSLSSIIQTRSRQPYFLKQKMIKKLRKNMKLVKNQNQRNQKLKGFIQKKQYQSKSESISACEFACPICLQMLMTPCPTSCGHIFCFRCVDESIIRSGNCPSCRNYIRNDDFIQSKAFSKICNFFWGTSCESNVYLEKTKINQQWLQNRMVKAQDLKPNDFLDVRDTEFIWCKAQILDIYKDMNKIDILVKYVGWNQIYNQVINANSLRLGPLNFFSQRTDIPHFQLTNPQDNLRSRIQYGGIRQQTFNRRGSNQQNRHNYIFGMSERRLRPVNFSRFHIIPSYIQMVVNSTLSSDQSRRIISSDSSQPQIIQEERLFRQDQHQNEQQNQLYVQNNSQTQNNLQNNNTFIDRQVNRLASFDQIQNQRSHISIFSQSLYQPQAQRRQRAQDNENQQILCLNQPKQQVQSVQIIYPVHQKRQDSEIQLYQSPRSQNNWPNQKKEQSEKLQISKKYQNGQMSPISINSDSASQQRQKKVHKNIANQEQQAMNSRYKNISKQQKNENNRKL